MPSRERDHHDVEVSSGADDRMRKRYEELKLLRVTQPEREAAASRKALEKHTAAADALVASLRAQLAAANPTAGSTSAEEDKAVAALRKENADLRRKLEEAQRGAAAPLSAAPSDASAALEAKVGFYEMMTGMSVELAAGDVAKCVVRCAPPSEEAATQTAPRHASFELHLSPAEGDEGDVEYVPSDLSAVQDDLPEYLLDSIVFEASQAPGFLSRLLSGVAVDR